MMTGRAAFGAAHAPPAEVQALVLAPTGPALPGYLPKPARALIAALLTRDPAKRLADAAAIKAHPFFAKVDWASLAAKRCVRVGGQADTRARVHARRRLTRGAWSAARQGDARARLAVAACARGLPRSQPP